MFINVIIAESIASNICILMADSFWGLTEKTKFCETIILQ